MEDQTIYILPPFTETQEATVITVRNGVIYYKTFDTEELGEIPLYAPGTSYEEHPFGGKKEIPTTTWTASSLLADLHDANVEKEFNNQNN